MSETTLYNLEKDGDVEGLISYIKESSNPAVRARAAEILSDVDADGDLQERKFETLIDASLDDEDERVRKAAAESLAWSDDVNVVKLLIDRYRGNSDTQLSETADWTLVKLLTDALEDGAAVIRMDAALGLGRIGDDRAFEPLVDALDDPDPQVRENAAWSLGELGDERAVKPLTKLLTDSNQEVRKQAATAITDLGGEMAVDSLIDALEDDYTYVRKQAAFALGTVGGERVIEPLLDALEDEDLTVRESAAFSLIEVMSNAPADKSHEIRETVSSRLEDLESEVSTQPIISALEQATEKPIRRNAAWLLGRVGGSEAVEPLVSALDDDEQVRRFAATSLAEIGEHAVDDLIESLDHKNPEVRKMAAFALGKIGDKRALGPLNEVIEDEDEEVRKFVFRAVNKLGGQVE
ncbi:MAG: HEAT repeat domain-containing protein [Halobacteria archaeon]|nr:HEAT repeat domain-containing protein [Halobacteria archaeon]